MNIIKYNMKNIKKKKAWSRNQFMNRMVCWHGVTISKINSPRIFRKNYIKNLNRAMDTKFGSGYCDIQYFVSLPYVE